MTKVVKDGITMVARDKNQLAAFLNNGWEKVGATEEIPEGEEPREAEPPKRRRKPAQK